MRTGEKLSESTKLLSMNIRLLLLLVNFVGFGNKEGGCMMKKEI
ncbi:hypothetical protein SDC9_147784 [bioreactor metagenome]|uniref:Uncharacterized protein n=1 Tax=bioreactor metagenome TaxID=1076179 RepID=A0A645EF04_9ZZZZ